MKSVGEGLLWESLPRGMRRSMTLADGAVLGEGAMVVSVHDISPRFEREFNEWRRLLDGWGVERRSLAVVPYHEGFKRLSKCPSLAAALREEKRAGSEIVLHGYTHRFQGRLPGVGARLRDWLTTDGCAEFATLRRRDAEDLIARGLEELSSVLPGRVRGFTAPGWWQSPEVEGALEGMGFLFFDSLWKLKDLKGQTSLHAPVLTGLPCSTGVKAAFLHRYNFSFLPLHLRKRPLVRVALHPYDLSNPRFVKAVEGLIKEMARTREVTGYEDCLQ